MSAAPAAMGRASVLQRAREELVEARVAVGIGLGGIAHVDGEQRQETADQQIAEPGRAHAGGREREARQAVMRQSVLKPDEQPVADRSLHPCAATMRSKSACKVSAVKGPVRIAAILPAGSTTKIAPE